MAHDIPPELAEQARRQLRHPELARTLHEQLGVTDSARPVVGTELHPSCQMLAHSLRAHQDASMAVSQYFGIALQQYHTAAEIIRRLERTCPAPAILDFACGYGRLLNLLIHDVPPDRIWASEIQPDAVSFAVEQFGVHGLLSSERPEDFEPGRSFDLIWVASLFSHLPPGLFQRWLQRLSGLLSPQGIMLFTVHDQALLPTDMEMPESGVLFIEGSENADLSTEIYGTTFVTEDYVRAAVSDVLGDRHSCMRLPRLINYEQDAYVIGGSPNRDLTEFADVPRGLRGWLDERSIGQDGALHLAGWAASMDNDQPVRVEISLDGRPQPCQTGEARPRVAEVLGKPGLSHCGWSARIELPRDRSETYLRIIARNNRGQRALIHAGALDIP
ncbi:MAG TPA: class I SAM-dependent methyltransferase [Wenzhouxiangellaceae bacterium]|nr:class I SAM-dependent methyltransferase [Wenzhouxiangellaceae bacterium]